MSSAGRGSGLAGPWISPQIDADSASSARCRFGDIIEFRSVTAGSDDQWCIGLRTGRREPGTTLKWSPLKIKLSRGGSDRPMVPGSRRTSLVRVSPTYSQRLSEIHRCSLLVAGAVWAAHLAGVAPVCS